MSALEAPERRRSAWFTVALVFAVLSALSGVVMLVQAEQHGTPWRPAVWLIAVNVFIGAIASRQR